MTKKNRAAAFTLIELLIVISIIAVLASIALPAFTGVKERGDQTKDLSNAKQIALALRQFAIDNNGAYPAKPPFSDYATATGTLANSNDAFWWLFPNYLQSETIFAASGSAYTPANPDNLIDRDAGGNPPAARAQTLKAGENHFAYVSNLTDTTNPTFPLLADGFMKSSPGTYTKDKSKTGGVWSGKKAVVVFCDSSGQLMNVNSAGKVPRPAGGGNAHLFETTSTDGSWLSDSNRILNPDPPATAQ
jgi:prepilin-type N-terminal cleavage/methylation domain-containing protein